MRAATRAFCVIVLGSFVLVTACRQESPVEKTDKPTDKAAEAIEHAIMTPIEKAKAVEGVVQGAAERTAAEASKGE